LVWFGLVWFSRVWFTDFDFLVKDDEILFDGGGEDQLHVPNVVAQFREGRPSLFVFVGADDKSRVGVDFRCPRHYRPTATFDDRPQVHRGWGSVGCDVKGPAVEDALVLVLQGLGPLDAGLEEKAILFLVE